MRIANTITDIELFNKMKTGDNYAYEMLFNRHWHALFQFSNKLLRSEEEAKDITQSLFLYFWDKRENITIRESVQSYLFQAIRYRSLTRLKELLETPQRIEEVPERLIPVLDDIMQSIDYEEFRLIVEKGMTNLPERTREIFKLSRYEELSIKEIAQKLGISERTVKNQLSFALKILRKSIALELVAVFLKIF
jgi:RNA polymerase sigma-70 factor (ECF subfamily)